MVTLLTAIFSSWCDWQALAREIRAYCLASCAFISTTFGLAQRLRPPEPADLDSCSNYCGGGIFEGVAAQEPFEGQRHSALALAATRISSNELEEGEARARARQVYRRPPPNSSSFEHGTGRMGCHNRHRGPDATYRVRFAPGNGKQATWAPALSIRSSCRRSSRQRSLHGRDQS